MKTLISETNKSNLQSDLPSHIAIIMDGNGRWAQAQGLPRTKGHIEGVEAVRRAVKSAIELKIPHLTLYSFSSENWSRPKKEVQFLMGLLKAFIETDLKLLNEQDVCVKIIGRRDNLAQNIVNLLEQAENTTQENGGLTLCIAFNYGGRDELCRAAKAFAAQAISSGTIEELSEARFSQMLDTGDMPNPDLILRTGGDQRISNFLIWQAAYAELIFIDEFWPDFSQSMLEKALGIYAQRERRFGGLGETENHDLQRKSHML